LFSRFGGISNDDDSDRRVTEYHLGIQFLLDIIGRNSCRYRTSPHKKDGTAVPGKRRLAIPTMSGVATSSRSCPTEIFVYRIILSTILSFANWSTRKTSNIGLSEGTRYRHIIDSMGDRKIRIDFKRSWGACTQTTWEVQ
jgi:hypothetical protein